MKQGTGPLQATLAVTFWREDDGSIRLILSDMQGDVIQGSMVSISDRPRRADGHPLLHRHLDYCLEQVSCGTSHQKGSAR